MAALKPLAGSQRRPDNKKPAIAGFCLCKRREATCVMLFGWCPGEDSNLHTLRHMDLNHARLPIPPPGHC